MKNRIIPVVKRRGRRPKLNAQLVAWEEEAWELAVQGMNLRQIGDKLFAQHGRRVTKSTIHRWLTNASRRAMKSLDDRIVQHKVQQVDILQRVFFEATIAWEKSKTGRLETSRKRTTPLVPGTDGIPAPTLDITTTKTEPSPGDPLSLIHI